MNTNMLWVTYQLRQLGWQGQLGLFFLLVTILLLGLIQANMREVRTLSLAVNHLHAHALKDDENVARTRDVARRFYAVLPAQNEHNQKISEILHAAEMHGLTPVRSDYVARAVPQSMMVQYQMRLPLVGRYLTIRKFITDVMNTQPSVALSNISFRRKDLDRDVVDANIEFILYTRAGES